MGNEIIQAVQGYAIFINTIADGHVSLWFDGDGKPVIYATREEAEREIVDDFMIRLQEYLVGEREFEDASTVEEYVVSVSQLPDGTLIDDDGRRYGPHRQLHREHRKVRKRVAPSGQ